MSLEYTRALRDLLNLSKNQEWQSIQPADMQVNLIAFFEYMSSTISFMINTSKSGVSNP